MCVVGLQLTYGRFRLGAYSSASPQSGRPRHPGARGESLPGTPLGFPVLSNVACDVGYEMRSARNTAFIQRGAASSAADLDREAAIHEALQRQCGKTGRIRIADQASFTRFVWWHTASGLVLRTTWALKADPRLLEYIWSKSIPVTVIVGAAWCAGFAYCNGAGAALLTSDAGEMHSTTRKSHGITAGAGAACLTFGAGEMYSTTGASAV